MQLRKLIMLYCSRSVTDVISNNHQNVNYFFPLPFFIFVGDFSAHEVDVDEQHILEAMIRTANETHAVFPDIPVFPVIGLHDYLVPLTLPNTSDWYNSVLSPWEPLMIYDGSAGDASKSTFSNTLRETFLEGGYYNASIAGIFEH